MILGNTFKPVGMENPLLLMGGDFEFYGLQLRNPVEFPKILMFLPVGMRVQLRFVDTFYTTSDYFLNSFWYKNISIVKVYIFGKLNKFSIYWYHRKSISSMWQINKRWQRKNDHVIFKELKVPLYQEFNKTFYMVFIQKDRQKTLPCFFSKRLVFELFDKMSKNDKKTWKNSQILL